MSKLKYRRKLLKPYFQTKLGKLYCGDCLDIMPLLQKVDLVLTSPPYNLKISASGGKYIKGNYKEHPFAVKYNEFNDCHSPETYYDIHKRAVELMIKLSKTTFWNVQLVTGSKEAIFKIIGDFNKNIKDIFIWDKGFGQPAMSPKVANRGYEFIIIFEKNGIGRKFSHSNFDRGTMPDVWKLRRAKPIKGHGARFPLKLAVDVIDNWTLQDEIVLDPFIGSGTTAIACEYLKRKWIGIELGEKNCKMAAKRIQFETTKIKII